MQTCLEEPRDDCNSHHTRGRCRTSALRSHRVRRRPKDRNLDDYVSKWTLIACGVSLVKDVTSLQICSRSISTLSGGLRAKNLREMDEFSGNIILRGAESQRVCMNLFQLLLQACYNSHVHVYMYCMYCSRQLVLFLQKSRNRNHKSDFQAGNW
jgi:hypothetical protein